MAAQFFLDDPIDNFDSAMLSSIFSDGEDKDYTFTIPTSVYEDDNFLSQLQSSSALSSQNNQNSVPNYLDNIASDSVSSAAFTPIDEPKFIIGQNVGDTENSFENYAVGDGYGTITGGNSQDVLIGDYGGSTLEGQKQNYNVVFVLDVSGSMIATSVTGESRLELMVRSVNELLADFSGFSGGEIKVHITAFDKALDSSGTFTVTNADEFNDAISYMNGLKSGGMTNYEAGLQSAANWLQSGDAIENATTTTYFLSDGFPNYAIDDATGNYVYAGGSSTLSAMDHILGLDGSDEVAQIQALSDEVIGVGINIGSSISNLQLIDSDGIALNVPADKLVAMMQETNPMTKFASLGDDVINGNDSNDIIFGDALYTDDLALTHGLTTTDGDGWLVFDQLESGLSIVNPDWDRADTLSYIANNAAALSEETMTAEGVTRIGGNDVLNGGAGNDLIFGQEGDDLIIGSAGNDILYGGSGADIFFYEALQDRIDVIKDFDVSEGDVLDLSELLTVYNPLQDSIDDFVFLFEQNGNTRVFADISGNDPITSLTEVVVLEGVTGVNAEELVNNGSLIIE